MFKSLASLCLIGIVLGLPREPGKNLNKHFEIIGGIDADISQFPWTVSIHVLEELVCGGTLISPNWILTAAHCVLVLPLGEVVFIRAGSNLQISGGVTANISEYVVHPDFNYTTKVNDIALLRLATNVTGINIHTAQLPDARQPVADSAELTVTGWGIFKENESSEILLQTTIPIVDQVTCKKIFPDVTDDMLCAGFLNTNRDGPCWGDSGGPALINGQVAGIVSWGMGCDSTLYPSVYTRVANYRSWITQICGV